MAGEQGGAVGHAEEAKFRAEVLPGGVLRLSTNGGLTEAEARAYLEAIRDAARGLPEPLPILADARRAGRHTRVARRVLLYANLDLPPSYLAVVGAGLAKRLFIRLAVHNTLVQRVRHFEDEEEALAWLRSVGPGAGPGA